MRFFLLSSIVLAACSSSASDSDSSASESGIVVTPTGDDQPGQVVLAVPPGIASSGPSVGNDDARFFVDQTPLDTLVPGKARTLAVGTHSLRLVEGNTTLVGFAIQNHALTTISLGGLAFTRSGKEKLLGVDAGMVVGRYTPADGPSPRWRGDGNLDVSTGEHQSMATVTARPARTYGYGFGLFDGFDVKVEPGKLTTVDVDGRTNRKQLLITAPVRTLPDAPGCGTWTIDAHGSGGETRSLNEIRPADGTRTLVGELVRPGETAATYTLTMNANGRSRVTMPMALGALGGEPARLDIQRVDVTDVSVKQTDGSTVVTKGTYNLSREVSPGVTMPYCSGPTSTGVDVVPGKYHLEVTYATVEAAQKVDVHDFSVP